MRESKGEWEGSSAIKNVCHLWLQANHSRFPVLEGCEQITKPQWNWNNGKTIIMRLGKSTVFSARNTSLWINYEENQSRWCSTTSRIPKMLPSQQRCLQRDQQLSEQCTCRPAPGLQAWRVAPSSSLLPGRACLLRPMRSGISGLLRGGESGPGALPDQLIAAVNAPSVSGRES